MQLTIASLKLYLDDVVTCFSISVKLKVAQKELLYLEKSHTAGLIFPSDSGK